MKDKDIKAVENLVQLAKEIVNGNITVDAVDMERDIHRSYEMGLPEYVQSPWTYLTIKFKNKP